MDQKILDMDGKLYKLVPYHPYWLPDRTKNPKLNDDTRRIMDLKSPSEPKHLIAVEHFGKLLAQGIEARFSSLPELQIAIVPSSTSGKISLGLERMLGYVKVPPKILYKREFLIRFKSIGQSHLTGNRTEQKHLDSIIVQDKPNPKIPIVLLDDVTTSGCSMTACETLLRNAGAGVLIKVAVGVTV